MAISRAADRVERDLDVKGCILHWLAEAHGFGSMEAYARWTVEQPEAQDPFARLLDRVEAAYPKGATATSRPPSSGGPSRPPTARRWCACVPRRAAEQRGRGAARQPRALAQMALMFWMRELSLREALAEHGDEAAWLADAEGVDRGLGPLARGDGFAAHRAHETRAARETLEDRYLSGHGSLFPATVDSWRELVERSEGLYEVATTLRPDDSFEPLEALRERSTSGARGDRRAARQDGGGRDAPCHGRARQGRRRGQGADGGGHDAMIVSRGQVLS